MPSPTTANRGYQKPHPVNTLDVDVNRLVAALDAIDGDVSDLIAAAVTKAGADTITGAKTFATSPLVPTALAGDNTTKAASTAFVQAALAALVDSSPGTLDTLNELAAALGDDPNFAATITAALANKADTTAVTAAVAAAVPAGVIMDFAGTTAPTGYLMCYGQPVNRTVYAELFAAIGTTYGAGDGATTFNLPDARGRVVAGKDDMGGTSANRLTGASGGVNGDVLGGTGGAETHTLTAAQLPAHNHTASTTIASGGAHQHDIPGGSNSGTAETGLNTTTWGGRNGDSVATVTTNGSSHSHTATTTVNNSTGGGGAHNNVQPTLVLNKIIKV